MKPKAIDTTAVTVQPASAPAAVMRQPDSPLALMAMAVERNADVATLERLRDLIEWNDKREAKKHFDAALMAFQTECPVLKRTVNGAANRYKFTPLDHVVQQVKPLLQRHGLSYRFTSEPAEGGTRVIALISAGGHTEQTAVFMPKDSGKTRDGSNLMSDPQQMAVALTYAQRYALQLALGIVTAGDDRDGQGPAPKTRLERLAQGAMQPVAQSQPAPGPAPAPVVEQPDTEEARKAAAQRLWTALKPVRGGSPSWTIAVAWMAEHDLIEHGTDMKTLSVEQLDALTEGASAILGGAQ